MPDSVSMFSAKEPGIEKKANRKILLRSQGEKVFFLRIGSNITKDTTNMGVTESGKKLSIIYGICTILIIYALLLLT